MRVGQLVFPSEISMCVCVTKISFCFLVLKYINEFAEKVGCLPCKKMLFYFILLTKILSSQLFSVELPRRWSLFSILLSATLTILILPSFILQQHLSLNKNASSSNPTLFPLPGLSPRGFELGRERNRFQYSWNYSVHKT